MIELTGIKKCYKDRTVLDIPWLAFKPGRRYALIGVNGCGKTTLLRIIAGIIPLDAGNVNNPYMDSLGYMPQVPYAFSFSVKKNVQIAFGNDPDAEEKTMKALRDVGIENLHTDRGNRLSGGESQRMAFARMIALPRRLLLLDEPTASADIRGTDQIEGTLLKYAAETGCTIIFSTHSPAQALRLANEVLFLDHGVIIEKGKSEQIIRNPREQSTKTFLKHWKI